VNSLSARLIRKHKPRVAHIWLGSDTACRMASTGGLNRRKYEIVSAAPRLPICTMCRSNAAQLQHDAPFAKPGTQLARIYAAAKSRDPNSPWAPSIAFVDEASAAGTPFRAVMREVRRLTRRALKLEREGAR
jgi:hypothetical protein